MIQIGPRLRNDNMRACRLQNTISHIFLNFTVTCIGLPVDIYNERDNVFNANTSYVNNGHEENNKNSKQTKYKLTNLKITIVI